MNGGVFVARNATFDSNVGLNVRERNAAVVSCG